MTGHQRPSAVEFPVVRDGPYAAIRLSPDAHAQYQQLFETNNTLAVQRRRHLARYFERFCEIGPESLGPEKFKREDSLPDGRGGHVSVYTFKPFKWRLYGGILTVARKRCFVGTRVDPDKKQDKADQQLLRAVAKDIADLLEYDR